VDDRPVGSGENESFFLGMADAETGLVEHGVMASAQQHRVS